MSSAYHLNAHLNVPSPSMHFVVSYPKSGNTWIRLAATAYTIPDVEPSELVAFDDQNSRVSRVMRFTDQRQYYYRSVSPIQIEDASLPVEVRLRPAAMLVLEREVSIATADIPPLVKSHHFYGEVNDIPLWHSDWADRVVNPVRDPREICCSYSEHLGKTYEETADFMARVGARTTGEEDLDHVHHFFSSWSNHVRGWLEADDIPVCTVRYEDLHAQPAQTFYEVFDFLDFPNLSEERVQRAVENTRFDKIKEAEKEQGFVEQSDDQDHFFRSGKTDGWKEELPTEVARKIEEDHGEMMEKLGYL
jgi:hypothetical protein